VKQHLAALRMLFDWLIIGHVLDVNPAHAVRGPNHIVKKGKTPVLTTDEARELLDSIALTRNTGGDQSESTEPVLIGLRDRALIGVMVYSFARINAVLEMKVNDYFVQSRRGWVRPHEKGGMEQRFLAITI
jgi:integrase/recombinase XerD